MKASFYTESILYWLARGVSALAQRLPPSANTAIGAGAGSVLYHLFPRRQVVAFENMRAAFGPAYTPAQYRKLLKEMYQNFGRTFMEVAAIPRINRAYVDRWVAIAPGSRGRIERALARGKGVLLITGHFGNWELIPIAGALLGFPTLVLAREQGWPRLNRLLTRYRESKGCKVIAKGFPIRELIQGLKEGKIVGILADQDGGKSGVLAEFFGRLASTAPGTIALSLSTGAPVLPVFVIREKGAAHTLVVEEPLEIPEEGPMERRIQAGVSAYAARMERRIRKHPSQWFWLHRRWKSSPERRLMIFSDGKAGHSNQSRALAERLEAAWKKKVSDDARLQGIHRSTVSVQWVEAAYRRPLGRLLLALAAALVPKHFSGGDRWLRWGLTPACYRAIRSAHADIGISCGAATAPVNLLWSWGIRAKTIHITGVRFPSWRRFDLAVLPRHDPHPEPAPSNLLLLDGALVPSVRVDPKKRAEWSKSLGSNGRPRIGLMLGGPTRGLGMPWGELRDTVQSLLAASDRLDADLLVTSSRRTPLQIEEALHELLKRHPRCRLLALVNRNDPGGLKDVSEAAGCILEMAQVCVVSGDSISMVSEALARSRPVVSFLPEKSCPPRPGKYQRFLTGLSEEGKVRLVPGEKVGEAVVEAMRECHSRPRSESGAGSSGSLIPDRVGDDVTEFLRRWL